MKPILTSLVLIFIATETFALSGNDVLHGAAHFGGVYAATHISEVFCTKAVGKKHKTACTIAGAAIANIANIAYKAHENFPKDTPRALVSGAIGSAAAVTIISLDW